jgi:hypothetical protein
MGTDITASGLAGLFRGKIGELQGEPEFQWGVEKVKYAVDENGEPSVKIAVGNAPLDYDLWEGLRNPAVVGLHPVGMREIWEFYANRRKVSVDEYGRQTIFQIPRSFDLARKNYSRAVIISVMLPFSQNVVKDYTRLFSEKGMGSSHLFSRMYEDVNLMIDKATSRAAIDLVSDDAVVVAMNNKNVNNVSREAVPVTRQGASHGPVKGGNYSQKSIAVLMGLGQFGKVQRFAGPIRSIVMFDKRDPVRDGSDGIVYPTEAWREFLFRLFDFTIIDPEVNRYRFCSYIPYDDEGCGKCVGCCPSGAQANSVPAANGEYTEEISKQTHRFWDGKLQFDFGRCCEERGQFATLFPEWSCARCLSMCVAEGKRRTYSAKNFYEKMLQLTGN